MFAPEPPLLSVANLTKHFPARDGRVVHAVDDVSFSVARGEVLSIVGESGCGKSTTARLLMNLVRADAGTILLDGEPDLTVGEMRRRMQMVFQDSYASLNPRMRVLDSITLAPRIHGAKRREAEMAARDLLARVGLDAGQHARRYPHELSGGQRQRVNIARALALGPRLLILDESVSALDKSVQAQILALLIALKRELGLTYLFISHDLNVVEYLSDRILVLYLGRVVEIGGTAEICGAPLHPYTTALLASRASLDPRQRTTRAPITGDPPSPIDPPSGCRFRTRCAHAEAVCAGAPPALTMDARGHGVACLMHQPGSGHSRAAA